MYPFKYEVKSWDEVDKKIEELHGITFANNYTEVMHKIEEYYSDTLDEVKISLLE